MPVMYVSFKPSLVRLRSSATASVFASPHNPHPACSHRVLAASPTLFIVLVKGSIPWELSIPSFHGSPLLTMAFSSSWLIMGDAISAILSISKSTNGVPSPGLFSSSILMLAAMAPFICPTSMTTASAITSSISVSNSVLPIGSILDSMMVMRAPAIPSISSSPILSVSFSRLNGPYSGPTSSVFGAVAITAIRTMRSIACSHTTLSILPPSSAPISSLASVSNSLRPPSVIPPPSALSAPNPVVGLVLSLQLIGRLGAAAPGLPTSFTPCL